MSLMSVTWTLFRSPGLCDKFDLDYILVKGDQLSKFIGKIRYLVMQDFPQDFLIETSSVNVKILKHKTGGITIGVCLISIAETADSVQQIGTGALLIANIYLFIYLFICLFIYLSIYLSIYSFFD